MNIEQIEQEFQEQKNKLIQLYANDPEILDKEMQQVYKEFNLNILKTSLEERKNYNEFLIKSILNNNYYTQPLSDQIDNISSVLGFLNSIETLKKDFSPLVGALGLYYLDKLENGDIKLSKTLLLNDVDIFG